MMKKEKKGSHQTFGLGNYFHFVVRDMDFWKFSSFSTNFKITFPENFFYQRNLQLIQLSWKSEWLRYWYESKTNWK